jgi:peroxiredoxin
MKHLQRIPWQLSFALVLALGAGWIWLSAPPPGATTGGEIPAPQAGFLAPDFSLSTADGQVITLSELRGRPLLLNFWASWCRPCRAEMPAMQQFYQEFSEPGPEQGFTILAVNASNQDNRAEALAFAESLGLSFPILFDQGGEAARLYQVRALPTSFFIDAQGLIQEVVIGGPMSPALLKIRLEELVAAGEGGP